jgi:hypothetical protein
MSAGHGQPTCDGFRRLRQADPRRETGSPHEGATRAEPGDFEVKVRSQEAILLKMKRKLVDMATWKSRCSERAAARAGIGSSFRMAGTQADCVCGETDLRELNC